MPSVKHLPTVTMAFLLMMAGLLTRPARADVSVGCGQHDSRDGSCDTTVQVPGPNGRPGRSPVQPRGKPIGGGGRGSQERSYWPVEGCLQHDLSMGVCIRFTPSNPSLTPTPREVLEPEVSAEIAVEHMDLKAPEIGM